MDTCYNVLSATYWSCGLGNFMTHPPHLFPASWELPCSSEFSILLTVSFIHSVHKHSRSVHHALRSRDTKMLLPPRSLPGEEKPSANVDWVEEWCLKQWWMLHMGVTMDHIHTWGTQTLILSEHHPINKQDLSYHCPINERHICLNRVMLSSNCDHCYAISQEKLNEIFTYFFKKQSYTKI